MDHMGSGGEALSAYLPPTPPKGTGYHRYVFALYKQQKGAVGGELKRCVYVCVCVCVCECECVCVRVRVCGLL